MSETEKIQQRYENRKLLAISYSSLAYDVLFRTQALQRALVDLFNFKAVDLNKANVLEVGCGGGGNLQLLLSLGAKPNNLSGIDLIEERIVAAKKVLPSTVTLYCGDASSLNIEERCVDVVLISTVFSSILDAKLRASVADKAWSLVKPGGGILWYDFTFDNPSNPDVKGVKLSEIKSLFPQGQIKFKRRLTLAPPLARWACKVSPKLYGFLNLFPFLRTHLMLWIEKQ